MKATMVSNASLIADSVAKVALKLGRGTSPQATLCLAKATTMHSTRVEATVP